MAKHLGQVITTDILASMVGEAYFLSFTPLNIMSGLKKLGVWPINPGEAIDWCTDALRVEPPPPHTDPSTPNPANVIQEGSPLFTPQVGALYMKRFKEHYDFVDDPEYIAWLKINRPEFNVSSTF